MSGYDSNLNDVETLWFSVDQRSIRDKLKKLLQIFITKKNHEQKQSWISPEHTEWDDLLQEIYERKIESDLHGANSESGDKAKKEEEKAACKNMRRTSMEQKGTSRGNFRGRNHSQKKQVLWIQFLNGERNLKKILN